MSTAKTLPVLSIVPSGHVFHSCVVTTYSLDFGYVEHQVMRSLRKKGIVNACILVDERMLQQSLGVLSGRALQLSRTYSINSISHPGAFHPKLYLFFGREQGLLIVGSGNLTAGGHGRNYELWNALHIDGPKDPKAPLFAQAWRYIRRISAEVTGYSRHKYEWIREHAQWVEDIPRAEEATPLEFGDGVQGSLLFGGAGASIFSSFASQVRRNSIQQITVMAPFFDSSGLAMQRMLEVYPKAVLRILLDPESAAGPVGMHIPKNRKVHLFDWRHVPDTDPARYLHAKLIHLQGDSTQYCLIGSANMTNAALGCTSESGQNDEVCLLLSRKRGDWLKEMGLANLGKEISLAALKCGVMVTAEGRESSAMPFRVRILAIDVLGDQVFIYLGGTAIPKGCHLVLYTTWGEEVLRLGFGEKAAFNKERERYEITCDKGLADAVYGQLIDVKSGKALSNKQIIHDIEALFRSNPDPASQRLETVLGNIEIGNAPLVELLEHLDLDELLVPTTTSIAGASGVKGNSEEGTPDDQGTGEVLSPEKFNEMEERGRRANLLKRLFSASSILRVFETLRTILNSLEQGRSTQDAVDEEAEKDVVESSVGRKELEETTHREPELPGEKEYELIVKRIQRFYGKYINILETQREKRHKANSVDFSMFMVALFFLIYLYKQPVRIKDAGRHGQVRELLRSCGDYFDHSDFCNIVTHVIGKFTYLLMNGPDLGDDDYIRRKISSHCQTAFYYAVTCLGLLEPCDVKQACQGEDTLPPDRSPQWLWSLYCNLRHYLFSTCPLEEQDVEAGVAESLHISQLSHKSQLKSCTLKLWAELERQYRLFRECSKQSVCIAEGDRIFMDPIGYAHVCQHAGEAILVGRPGFPESDSMYDFEDGRKFLLRQARPRKIEGPQGSLNPWNTVAKRPIPPASVIAGMKATSFRPSKQVDGLAANVDVRKVGATFCLHWGIAFKRDITGNLIADPYCPECHEILSEVDQMTYRCRSCLYTTRLPRSLADIVRSVNEQ